MKITVNENIANMVIKRAAFYKKLASDTDRESEADLMETISVIESDLSEYLHKSLGVTDDDVDEYWRLEGEDAA